MPPKTYRKRRLARLASTCSWGHPFSKYCSHWNSSSRKFWKIQITWACFPMTQLWHKQEDMFSNQGFPNSLPRRSVERFGFTTYMGQGIKINTNMAGVIKAYNRIPSHAWSAHVQRQTHCARLGNRLLNLLPVLWRKCKVKCYLFSLSVGRPFPCSNFLIYGVHRNETSILRALYKRR